MTFGGLNLRIYAFGKISVCLVNGTPAGGIGGEQYHYTATSAYFFLRILKAKTIKMGVVLLNPINHGEETKKEISRPMPKHMEGAHERALKYLTNRGFSNP